VLHDTAAHRLAIFNRYRRRQRPQQEAPFARRSLSTSAGSTSGQESPERYSATNLSTHDMAAPKGRSWGKPSPHSTERV
jgi:hypothetical protein